MSDIFAELKEKALIISQTEELPVWLLNDILEITNAAEQYGDKTDDIRQLVKQLENFDIYAGTGCFGDAVGAEAISATIRKIKGV